ncbi:MAG: hypothetical protein ACI3XQ_02400 [Eubacteriales bacterium]
MKKRHVKLLALLMSVLMLAASVTTLASCKKGDQTTDDTTASTTTAPANTDGEDIDYKTLLPEATFDGADFNILIMGSRAAQFIADECDIDVIKDELVARDKFVEEKYDIYLNIDTEYGGWSAFHQQCQTDLWAGTAQYDIISPDYYYMTETAGYFLNLADYDVIHFENPYFVDGWNKSATINGKIFTAVSYLTLDPISAARILCINNYFAEDINIDVDEIKKKVYNGEWTLEEMQIYMSMASSDNGDGIWDFDDKYGLGYNLWGGRAMLWSAGLKLSEINDDGTISQTFVSDRNVDIFQAIYKFFDNAYCYYGGGANESDGAKGDIAQFYSGRSLFLTTAMGSLTKISKELDSFSVLPHPKFDTAQDDYITSMTGSVVFGIMKTAKDPVMSATILEALSILNYEDIRPAYYDSGLKLRYSSDPDTAKMIDLIMSKIEVDFAFINSSNFDGIADIPFNLIADENRNYVSGMNKYVNAFEQNLENFYDAYSDDPTGQTATGE